MTMNDKRRITGTIKARVGADALGFERYRFTLIHDDGEEYRSLTYKDACSVLRGLFDCDDPDTVLDAAKREADQHRRPNPLAEGQTTALWNRLTTGTSWVQRDRRPGDGLGI